jgi:putative acyl-CoA dehydrogenase
VQLTRLDCVLGSVGIMRSALMQAIHHTRYRTAFQKKLVDQPLMRAVLADLALEREAAVALGLRLAAAFDRAADDAEEAAFARLVTPAAKLLVCKSVPGFVYEALECMGGNGYVEEGPFARLYREAPLNAIWEGSGNIMALDLMRGIERDREGAERVLAGLARPLADLPNGPAALDRVRANLRDPGREALARRTTEMLAQLAAAVALKAAAPAPVAEAYAAARLGGLPGRNYGNPMPGPLVDGLLNRGLANGR